MRRSNHRGRRGTRPADQDVRHRIGVQISEVAPDRVAVAVLDACQSDCRGEFAYSGATYYLVPVRLHKPLGARLVDDTNGLPVF
ncbi:MULTISPECIES: hypothetical protein [unclassified Actinoplanes]|uniref:hypothetical protein n=1 Tax=unclassified Actinoplanes TaxID=2626549 RepID=UPI0012BAEE9A|nr:MULTISPECIES: hypothetical protein [unclassified Actinoplanes]